MKPQITFEFNFEKLVAALTYLASNVTRDLTKLRASKLLFFADQYHLVTYGRPVIGDQYAKLPYGPVPSQSLNIMNDLERPVKIPGCARSDLKTMESYLEVVPGPYPTFKARKNPDRSVLSDSDIEALNYAVAKYGRMSPGQLVSASHSQRPWKESKHHWIDYRLFFDDSNEDQQSVLSLLEEEQETESFLASTLAD